MADRYLKVVLTVIALELLWIAAKDTGVRVWAQQIPAPAAQGAPRQPAQTAQPPEPIPVIITGIELAVPGAATADPTRSAIPVYSAQVIKVDADRPIAVVGASPMKVEADRPLPVRADEPLPVRNVPYTPGRTPGE